MLILLAALSTVFVWRNEIRGLFRRTRSSGTQSAARPGETSGLPASQATLTANWSNEDVLIAAAAYLNLLNDPAAIAVHRRLVELSPSDMDRHFELILCALRNKDYTAAAEAIQQARLFGDKDRSALDLLEASAAKRNHTAEGILDQMRKSSDNTPGTLLRLNVLRLQVVHPSVAPLVLSEIQKIGSHSEMRPLCLRELIRYNMRTSDFQTAKRRAQDLMTAQGATFSDTLLGANIALITRQNNVDGSIPELAPRARKSSAAAAQFSSWLIMQGRSSFAVKWLEEYSKATGHPAEILSAEADLAVARKDWKLLETLLGRNAWGAINPEALKMAMSARLLNERRTSDIRVEMWGQALKGAQGRMESLKILLRLARIWQWEAQVADTLRSILDAHPSESWAFWNLAQIEAQAGNTASLREVFARWHAADPSSDYIGNEWAMLVLLVSPDQSNTEVRTFLEQLNSENPKCAPYAVSHAFSLWQQGRAAEALPVLLKLKSYELRDSRRALYCALVLIDTGKTDIAEKLLPLVSPARLLPEEKRLLQQARSRIQDLAKLFLDEAEDNDEDSTSLMSPIRPAK